MEAGSRSSLAPDRAAPPAPRPASSWLAQQGRLPLAFMVLGLVWLAVATTMLVVAPGRLAWPHAAPAVVALTHAWVLGVFVTVATGAAYQIAPVALGTTLWRERWGWWHFGLQLVSVPGMVLAFARWDMALLGHFGSAFAAGIVLFAINTWQTVRRSGRSDAVAWSLHLAAGWLLATVIAGLVVAANRFWHFLPFDFPTLLRAHAHLGLVGFFLTLLQGVTFQLVPMFTLGNVPSWRPVRAGLWLSQIGLVLLIIALLAHMTHVACVAALLIWAGIAASAHALRRTLATRKKRVLDPGLRAFLGGGAGLALAPALGLLLLWPASPLDSAAGRFGAMPYAVVIFAGGLLPAIAGMLGKIVPFLVWMCAYGPKVGRMPTPAAAALTRPRLEGWGLTLQAAAALPFFVGAWSGNSLSLVTGACLLSAGVGLFLANMVGVLAHLRATAKTIA